jgi:hypothetical protein
MIKPSVRDEVLKAMEKLGTVDQLRVVEFMRELGSSTSRGTPGAELARFGGILSEESVDEMVAAIGEGCERVDEEW